MLRTRISLSNLHSAFVTRRFINAVIMGPPGGGKGTISKKLVKDFGLLHFSMGDLLREHVKLETPSGIAAKEIILAGGLVPDKIVLDILVSSLKGKSSVLLDGFPRTIEQAKFVVENIHIDVVLALDIPHDVIIERISNRWIHAPSGRTYALDYNPPKRNGFDDITGEALTQRDDDKPETVRKRLDTYENITSPLLHFFGDKGMLKVFSGTESDVIYPEMKAYLLSKFKFS